MRGNLVPLCLGPAGVSTVMRTLPPQPPEGHQRRRRGRHESAWRLRVAEVNLLFNLRESAAVFSHPTLYQSKQLITITDNETIGRVDHAIKRLRCDMRPNTIRQSGKVGPLRPEFR